MIKRVSKKNIKVKLDGRQFHSQLSKQLVSESSGINIFLNLSTHLSPRDLNEDSAWLLKQKLLFKQINKY